jgi:hypothetical protein
VVCAKVRLCVCWRWHSRVERRVERWARESWERIVRRGGGSLGLEMVWNMEFEDLGILLEERKVYG